jgi:hypothetical protein
MSSSQLILLNLVILKGGATKHRLHTLKLNEMKLNARFLSPVYTTLNFWYDTDKIGTRTTFLVLGLTI